MIYVKSIKANTDTALALEINRLLCLEFRGKQIVSVMFVGHDSDVNRIYQIIMKD